MRHRYKFVVFCIVGSMAMAIDFLFFNIFYFFTSIFVLSRILGVGISMIFNFTTNRNLTFSAKKIPCKRQLPKFLLVHGVAMIANISVGVFVLHFLEPTILNANIAAIIGLGVSVPTSFLGSLFWTFSEKRLS